MNLQAGRRLVFLAASASLCVAQPLERAARSVVEVRGETAPGQFNQGSGVVIGTGLIATNAHVLRNAYRVSIHKDGAFWEVPALCISPEQDLVLLRIPSLPLPPAEIAPEASLKEGTPLVAWGYPMGHGPLPSHGTLLAFWKWRDGRLLQTDAHIEPGSSGGGLFTTDGRLAGITTFFLSDNQRAAFAIPGEWVASLEMGGPTPAGFRCPVLVPDRLILDFQDLISEDPHNRDNWDALTRQWVASAPGEARAWFARGTALDMNLRAGQGGSSVLDEATMAYQKAVALDSQYAKAWNNLGTSMDLQNRFTEAQEAFRKAIALKPSYALAWFNLGSSLFNSGKISDAIVAFKQGLALAPDEDPAWARLAYCEARLNQWSQAADHYRIALRYAPYRAEWWGERYLACRKLNLDEEAREALERIQALAPDLAAELKKRH